MSGLDLLTAPPGDDEEVRERDPRDAARRRARIILLLTSIPFAIAALLLVVKLLGLSPAAQRVIDSYEFGAYGQSVTQAEQLLTTNWFQPWIAPFDRGTAYAAGGLYNDAIDDLEQALELAPADARCDVAVNLSLSWELLGDSYVQQGLFAGAQRLYETARAVITEAGEECRPPNAPRNEEQNRDPGQELSDAAQRLEEKADQSGERQEQLERGQEGDGDLQDQLDQLGEQLDDAAREKAERESQERSEEDGGGFTDRPW